MKHILTLLTALLLASPAALHAANRQPSGGKTPDFVVATTGNDAGPGTVARPFRTLVRARDAVRELKKVKRDDILVQVRGGQYPLAATVVFGVADSGGDAQMIRYEAAPGEKPVFSSAVRLRGWQPAADLPSLPAAARGKVWVAPLPGKIGLFRTLFDGETMLPRARTAGFIPTIDAFGRDKNGHLRSRTVMHYPAGAPIRNYPNLADIEIVIRPFALWVMNILPLAAVDETNRTVTTAIPGTYFLTRERYNRLTRESVWVENTLDGMTRPGNWCVNTQERKVYYWPASGRPGDGIVVPTLKEYILVQGDIHPQGPADVPVRNLGFKGLVFTQGERDTWTSRDRGCQHDWEIYDKENAYLRLRGAEGCVVESCEFRHGGGGGVRLDLHAQRNVIRDNHLHHLGGTGIALLGYGAGRKDVHRQNQILNNHIHDIGQLYWMCHGILISQSGENRIAHNLIHDVPYNGMAITGYRPYFFHNAFRDACRRGTLEGTDYSWAYFYGNTEALGLREIASIRWDEIGQLHDFKLDRFETGYDEVFNLVQPYIHSRMNVVENNEIHHAMQVLGDGNGLYVSDTGPGTVIRHNHFHHIATPAIRTDAHQRDTVICGNIVAYCGGGIACYNNNQAYHNIIAFTGSGQDADGNFKGHGSHYSASSGGFPDGVIQRNIIYDDKASRPTLSTYPANDKLRSQIDYNLFYFAGEPAESRALLDQWRAEGYEQHSLYEDPLFVDARNGNYLLKPESPALRKLGFPQLDVKQMGLLRQPSPKN